MKDQFISLTDNLELSASQLALFYAKDIISHRNLDVSKAESYIQIA